MFLKILRHGQGFLENLLPLLLLVLELVDRFVQGVNRGCGIGGGAGVVGAYAYVVILGFVGGFLVYETNDPIGAWKCNFPAFLGN